MVPTNVRLDGFLMTGYLPITTNHSILDSQIDYEPCSMSRSNIQSGKYRLDIDGLRAIAVLSVMFFHADIGFSGGYVGVDIFFVISGYLITGLILKDCDRGRFQILEFWERRVRRLLAALVVVVFTSLVVGWFQSRIAQDPHCSNSLTLRLLFQRLRILQLQAPFGKLLLLADARLGTFGWLITRSLPCAG